MADFPSPEWLQELKEKLNGDEKYHQIARNWEGDLRFILEPSGSQVATIWMYIGLWHGKCQDAFFEQPGNQERKPPFVFTAPYDNFARILKGEIAPMQALMTRKLAVRGNMAVLMRSVPTVLEFVRCCREVTGHVA
jgi:putative sterol carrier protein